MAAPPYLTTMVFPRNFWMKGKDSERISTLLSGEGAFLVAFEGGGDTAAFMDRHRRW